MASVYLLGGSSVWRGARTDLDEVVASLGVHKELDRTGIEILRLARKPHRIGMQLLAKVHWQRPRRRHLDDFLMAALHRAVALPEVDDVVAVSNNLDFYMSWIFHVPVSYTHLTLPTTPYV